MKYWPVLVLLSASIFVHLNGLKHEPERNQNKFGEMQGKNNSAKCCLTSLGVRWTYTKLALPLSSAFMSNFDPKTVHINLRLEHWTSNVFTWFSLIALPMLWCCSKSSKTVLAFLHQFWIFLDDLHFWSVVHGMKEIRGELICTSNHIGGLQSSAGSTWLDCTGCFFQSLLLRSQISSCKELLNLCLLHCQE